MTSFIKWLGPLMNLSVMFVKLISVHHPPNYKRLLANIFAITFLCCGFIFGCIALYSYLLPYWGHALSFFALCLLFLGIGSALYISGRYLKSTSIQRSSSFFEKGASHVPCEKSLNNILPNISFIALCTVILAVSYVVSSKKNNSD